MKHGVCYRAFLCTLFILCTVPFARAQSGGSIKGKIIDTKTAEGLASAHIKLTSSGKSGTGAVFGTISKSDGSYEIASLPAGTYTIHVSYLGYKTYNKSVTVEANAPTAYTIEMQPDYQGLDEVVVTGEAEKLYKSESQVAVSTINAAKVSELNSYQDLSQLMDAKIPGVTVTPGSGTVGGGFRFDIRSGAGLNGSGQPLIYIDGVRVENTELGNGVNLTGGQSFSSLSGLNPEDIEDIQVLKGPAAAALYGTSGSNGVVLIRTKHGDRGVGTADGIHLLYKVISGVNEQATKYDASDALTFDAANATFRTGPFTEHDISLTGGSPALNYYASFGHRNEDGIQYNNSFERNSVRANFTANPSDKVSITASTNLAITDAFLPQNDNNILGALGGTLIFGPTSVGSYGPYAGADSSLGAGITTENKSTRFIGSIEGTYTPITDLSFRGLFGLDANSYRIDQTWPSNLDYSAFGVQNGERYIQNGDESRLNIDLSGRYNWHINDNITAQTTAGTQLYYSTLSGFWVEKENFPTQLVTNVGAGQKFITADESFLASRTAGLYLLEDVSIDEAYLFSAGVRNEYASAIGTEAPSIFYPRVSGAVRLDKLDVTPSDFNLFKIRAAYGQSGILPDPLQVSGLRWGGTPSGSGVGAQLTTIGNDSLLPERVGELELGLDLEYHNTLGAELTYFMQNASNSIVSFQNAPSTGLTVTGTPQNVGSIKGSGFEAHLYSHLFQSRDYQLDLNLNISYATNTVTSLGGAPPIFSGENAIVEGQPRAAFYTFAVRGALFNSDGTYAGPKTDTTRSYLGNPIAPSTGSFNISFRFLKNFTFNILTDWSFGGTIHNLTRTFQTYYGNDREYNTLINELGLQGNSAYIVGSFVGDSTIKPLTPGSAAYNAAANRLAQLDPNSPGAIGYFESSDFIRIREIGLRYDFTSLIADALPGREIQSLSVSFGIRNVMWLMKKYSGPDVELNTQGSTYTIYRGQDFLTLQNPRVISGTVTIGF